MGDEQGAAFRQAGAGDAQRCFFHADTGELGNAGIPAVEGEQRGHGFHDAVAHFTKQLPHAGAAAGGHHDGFAAEGLTTGQGDGESTVGLFL